MQGEQEIADTAERNAAAEFCAGGNTSGGPARIRLNLILIPRADCAFIVKDFVITEHCSSTSINHDFGGPQSHQEVSGRSAVNGDYFGMMHEESENDEMRAAPLYDQCNRSKYQSRRAV